MTSQIKSALGRLREFIFECRLHSEIFGSMAKHCRGIDQGYAFRSKEELGEATRKEASEIRLLLARLEAESRALPRNYGNALLYIAYRDLNHRIGMYRLIAHRNMPPRTFDPRLAAHRV